MSPLSLIKPNHVSPLYSIKVFDIFTFDMILNYYTLVYMSFQNLSKVI